MVNDSIRICNNIEISSQDDRDYHAFTLDNQLQVLVISHPETDKASAAMDVHVGHLCDPDELPGLAHFLEHMLFLGTEKYPDENSYNSYLSSHGGSSNAFTSMTDTNYYFDISSTYLKEALDRFAQFFIAPLFTQSATDREIKAVDSENAKNLQNDYWRFNQLYKHFARSTHPFHKFGTGNLQTLSIIPQEKGINVREALLNFHETYYSASIMRLVIYGKEDVHTLEKWARDMFSNIRNTGRTIPVFDGNPYGEEQMKKQVLVTPVKDLRLIEIVWPLPTQRPYYREKPNRYLSHLLGHEGKGSLLSYLKEKRWANELSAGLTKDEEDFSVFSVTIEATEEGIEHVYEVIYAIFQYIDLLKQSKPQEWIFNETKQLGLMSFRFKNKETPINYTSSLAGRMHRYPSSLYISGSNLMYEFNAEYIENILKELIPSRMRWMLVSKVYEKQTTSIEKWYQTPYLEKNIEPEFILKCENAKYTQDFALPLPNELISTDFSLIQNKNLTKNPLKSNTIESSDLDTLIEKIYDIHIENTKKASSNSIMNYLSTKLTFPENIYEDDTCRTWYKYDSVFQKPKLNIFLHLISPMVYATPYAAVYTDLYVRCVKDKLTEFAYDAELAGLRYVFSFSMKGLELYVSGYNHKLPVLLEKIVYCMIHMIDELKETTFQRLVDKLKRSYANFNQEQPYQHAVYNASYSFEEKKWHNNDKLTILERGLSINALKRYIQSIFHQIYIESLFHGNIQQEMAIEIVKKTLTTIQTQPLFLSQFPNLRIVQLKEQTEYYDVQMEPNENNHNSAIHVVMQVGEENPRQRALLELLVHIMKEPCFNELRTKEQLGYIVFSGLYRHDGVDGLRVIVQSDKATPKYLDERIEAFWCHLENVLKNMPLETFETYVNAVTSKLLEKPKTPWEESMRYWREITSYTYQFQRKYVTALLLKSITLKDIQTFFQMYVSKSGPCRKKFSTQIMGHMKNQSLSFLEYKKELEDQNISTVWIQNVELFKRQMPLYPVRTRGDQLFEEERSKL